MGRFGPSAHLPSTSHTLCQSSQGCTREMEGANSSWSCWVEHGLRLRIPNPLQAWTGARMKVAKPSWLCFKWDEQERLGGHSSAPSAVVAAWMFGCCFQLMPVRHQHSQGLEVCYRSQIFGGFPPSDPTVLLFGAKCAVSGSAPARCHTCRLLSLVSPWALEAG